ncbi:MAG: metallophosphoesterase [Thiotrichaceae bacterium]
MKTQHILSLTSNLQGRDFIVGDIHGMFHVFDRLLEKVKFNPELDRVISVGDLIDRGPDSHRVLEYIDHPWFFSIMGNHEQMCLDAATDYSTYKNWVNRNGGAWWDSMDELKQQAIRKAFSTLPTVAEIATNNGTIGVVHADISTRISWDRFTKNIAEDKNLRHFAIWSRARYDRYKAIGDNEKIQGVKFVVVGHTPVTTCIDAGNVRFIDTGAAFTETKGLGKLTLMQIQPEIKLIQQDVRKKKKWSFS